MDSLSYPFATSRQMPPIRGSNSRFRALPRYSRQSDSHSAAGTLCGELLPWRRAPTGNCGLPCRCTNHPTRIHLPRPLRPAGPLALVMAVNLMTGQERLPLQWFIGVSKWDDQIVPGCASIAGSRPHPTRLGPRSTCATVRKCR